MTELLLHYQTTKARYGSNSAESDTYGRLFTFSSWFSGLYYIVYNIKINIDDCPKVFYCKNIYYISLIKCLIPALARKNHYRSTPSSDYRAKRRSWQSPLAYGTLLRGVLHWSQLQSGRKKTHPHTHTHTDIKEGTQQTLPKKGQKGQKEE